MALTKIVCDIGHNWRGRELNSSRGETLIREISKAKPHGVIIPMFNAQALYREEKAIEETERYNMTNDIFARLVRVAKEEGLSVYASIYEPSNVAIANKFGVDGYHLSNGIMRYDAVVRTVAQAKRRTLIATGVYVPDELAEPLSLFDMNEVVLMHSSGIYPTFAKDSRIGMIGTWVEYFLESGIVQYGYESTLATPELDFTVMGYNLDYLIRKVDLDDEEGIEKWSVGYLHIRDLVEFADIVYDALYPELKVENLTANDLLVRNFWLRDPDDFLLPCRCGEPGG